MEKKKLLLVAISVGIFLVIAIGAAIVLTPQKPAASAGTIASHPAGGSYTGITVPSPSYSSPSDAASGTSSESPQGSDQKSASSLPAANAAPSQPATVDPVDLVRSPGDVPGLKPAPEGSTRQGSDFYVTGAGQPGNNPRTVINVPRPTTAAVPDAAPAAKAVDRRDTP